MKEMYEFPSSTPNKFTCHTHFAQLEVRMRSFRKDSARNELVKGDNTTAMKRSSTMGVDTGGGWGLKPTQDFQALQYIQYTCMEQIVEF